MEEDKNTSTENKTPMTLFDKMNKLFQNLIWPAVAGNVAWAFFTVATSEKWSSTGVIPRLLSLLLMAIYLCYDWVTTDSEKDKLKEKYWIGDAFHTITIIVFAIIAQSSKNWENLSICSWTNWSLTAVFLATVIGHICGAWEPKNKKNWCKRFALAGINFSGIIIYWILPCFVNQESLWHLPSSILIILLLWFPLRDKIYPKT